MARLRRYGVCGVLSIALLASACHADPGGHPARPATGRASTPAAVSKAETIGGLTTATDTFTPHGTTTTDAATAALAGVGIATVTDDTSAAPLVAVTGPQVSLVTADQVAQMVAQANDGGGLLGSGIDASFPLSDDPSVPITMTELIGAWVVSAPDAAAQTAGQLAGTTDWSQPGSVVVPGLVVDLFVADLTQHVVDTGAPSSTASPAAYLPRLDPVQTPCTDIASFINKAMDTFFGYLHVDAAEVQAYIQGHVGGFVGTLLGWLGSFAANIVNGLVAILHTAVSNVVAYFTDKVIGYIRIGVGALYAAQDILSFFHQTQALVTPAPTGNQVAVGAGAAPHAGTFTVSIPDNDQSKGWPPQIADCARWAKVPPPVLVNEGAPVDWEVLSPPSWQATVTSPGGSGSHRAGRMNAKITDTLGYETGVEPSASGSPHAYPLTVGVGVERSQIKPLEDMVSGLFQGAGPLQPFVDLAVHLVMAKVKDLLKDLIQIPGRATVPITFWGSEPPPVDPSCQATTIPAGTYVANVDNDVTIDERFTLKGAQFLAATAVNHFAGTITITSDGHKASGKVVLHGYAIGHGAADIGVPLKVTGRGTMVGRITGPAATPVATVRASGSWVDNDPLGGQHSGSGSSTLKAGLHLTEMNCAEVDGDLTATVQEMLDGVLASAASSPDVGVFIKASGDGQWAAIRQ